MVTDRGRTQQITTPYETGSAPGEAPAASDELLTAILASLDDDKAVEPVTIELARKSSIADYMVVAGGTSQRQIAAMAEHLGTRLKKVGHKTQIEGLPRCDWVLIDAGEVIVHLFRPEARAFYNLEKMWSVDFQHDTAGSEAVI